VPGGDLRRVLAICLLFILGLTLSQAIFFAQSTKGEDTTLVKTIQIHQTSNPPKIDGKLDDPCWKECQELSDFVQFDPKNGEAPTEKTSVWMCYDENNLYVAFYCYDSEPKKVTAHIARRDYASNDDVVCVILDTFNDKRFSYWFALNPYGIQGDFVGDGNGQDETWDAIWHSNGNRTADGWTGEMAIPFKSLRFSTQKEQTWGINLLRLIRRKGEQIFYTKFPREDPLLDHSAKLTGLKDIKRGYHFEFLPYSTFRSEKKIETREKNKFDSGLDVKYGLTSNLTLDFTLNPDFGQIESDQDQINLSPYETYFREKRPFFLERSDIFGSRLNLFYSRRIVDPIEGLKLTGKIDKYTIGLIQAVDEVPEAPDKQFYVFKLKRDVFKLGHIAFMGTSLDTKDDYSRAINLGGYFPFKNIYTLTLGGAKVFNKGVETDDWAYYLEFERWPDKGFNFRLEYNDVERNFMPKTGYIRRTDYREFESWFAYQFRPKEFGLKTVNPGAGIYYTSNHSGTMTYQGITPEINLSFVKNVFLSFGFGKKKERPQVVGDSGLVWSDQTYTNDFFYVNFNRSSYGFLDGGLSFNQGEAYVYKDNYTRTEPGTYRSFSLWAIVKPLVNLELETNVSHQSQYQNNFKDRIYNIWIIDNRVKYQITKDIFTRIFFESNLDSHQHQVNFLVGYNYRPGSYLYLAYNEQRDNSAGRFWLKNRVLMLKATYLWSI
jgi:hypothetical protein